MPTVGKWLVIVIIFVSLGFIYLSASVLELRRNWDAKVVAKKDDVAKMAKTVDELRLNTEEASKEYQPLVQEFEVKMGYFLERKTVENYQNALRELNSLAGSGSIEESQWVQARNAYQAAENELARVQAELDEAYSAFFGQDAAHPGVRGLAYKGLGTDPMRELILRINASIVSQRTNIEIQRSDGEKNLTELTDMKDEKLDEALVAQEVAADAELERIERVQERDQFRVDLEREQRELVSETERLNEMNAELAKLRQDFRQVTGTNLRLVKGLKEAQIRFDALQGVKTAVLSPDGLVPKGKVLDIDGDGTVHINIGTRVGVRRGVQLHVFRFSPEPRYLGLIEILRSDSDSATGRMLPTFRQLPVQAGDNVSPEITL